MKSERISDLFSSKLDVAMLNIKDAKATDQ